MTNYKIPFSVNSNCITVNHKNPVINNITINQKFNSLVFLHTCNLNKKILLSYQFFDYSDREIIGYYEVIYEESLKELIPIRYGINIYNFNSNYKEVIKSLYYFTTPVIIKTQKNNIIAYSYEWINPHQSKLIRYINLKFTDNSKEGRLHLLAITGIRVS